MAATMSAGIMRVLAVVCCLLMVAVPVTAHHGDGGPDGDQQSFEEGSAEPSSQEAVADPDDEPDGDKCPWLVITGPHLKEPYFSVRYVPECWPPF